MRHVGSDLLAEGVCNRRGLMFVLCCVVLHILIRVSSQASFCRSWVMLISPVSGMLRSISSMTCGSVVVFCVRHTQKWPRRVVCCGLGPVFRNNPKKLTQRTIPIPAGRRTGTPAAPGTESTAGAATVPASSPRGFRAQGCCGGSRAVPGTVVCCPPSSRRTGTLQHGVAASLAARMAVLPTAVPAAPVPVPVAVPVAAAATVAVPAAVAVVRVPAARPAAAALPGSARTAPPDPDPDPDPDSGFGLGPGLGMSGTAESEVVVAVAAE